MHDSHYLNDDDDAAAAADYDELVMGEKETRVDSSSSNQMNCRD